MKRSIIIFLMLLSLASFSQEQKHVVFLKNKDNNPYSLNNPLQFLSQRALDRRAKNGISPDQKDLPVTPSYVSQIAALGAPVVYTLKWFNAVVIKTSDPAIIQSIAALPFVDHIDQVVTDQPSGGQKSGIKSAEAIPPYTINKAIGNAGVKSAGTINYGQAYNQVHMIQADALHDSGYTGDGVVVAVLDAGFYHVDQIQAFDSLFMSNRILGTRDFHLPGNNVYGDDMHTHGTSVLSTMGANLPGEIVGTAPHASYWLVRTEVGEYEALIEEYNWAAGAEFADSVGADLINSSLGYTTFDNPMFDHSYADMNGNTTPVTRAADLACSRGILVVNSAGNSGGSTWQYIGAPADGDSVFSIGAVDAAGNYAGFSSTGPTSDGRIKPDVTAQGQGTIVVSGWGWVGPGSGTSFSSPVTAGGLACLMQSLPSHTAQQIRDGVRSTASQASQPDNLYGYGIPKLSNARLYLGTADKENLRPEAFRLTPNPFAGAPLLINLGDKGMEIRVELMTFAGQLISTASCFIDAGGSVRLERLGSQPAGIYFVRVISSDGTQILRAIKK